MRRLILIATFVLALLTLSCGGGGASSGGNTEDTRNAIEYDLQAFADAVAEGRAGAAYSYLGDECRREISLQDFASVVILGQGFIGEDWQIKLNTLDIIEQRTDKATVKATWQQSSGNHNATFSEFDGPIALVRQDGKWRVASCDMFASGDGSAGSTPGPGNAE
jgi:hypothetical protein